MHQVIKTKNAPEAIGPYVQAIKAGNFIFTAGQVPLSPVSGVMVEGGVREQTVQVIENLKAIIEAGGGTLSSIMKTTVYLTKPDDFTVMNEIYSKYFALNPPARTTVFISALPKGALVEIDAIAAL